MRVSGRGIDATSNWSSHSLSSVPKVDLQTITLDYATATARAPSIARSEGKGEADGHTIDSAEHRLSNHSIAGCASL